MNKFIRKIMILFLVFGGMFHVFGGAMPIRADAFLKDSSYVETASVDQTHDNLHLNLGAKSAYLMDERTKTEIYSENATKRLPIASMCKIMTLILTFDAINRGELSMDDTVCISEKAASMGGSQVFLEAGGEYSVRSLVKSIIVCSANDSCVALAEKICGNVELFTDKMNDRAKELGAENTLFANCTGLPKEPQYSCAKDVAVFLKELISNEEYFTFSNVWMDRFEHPKGRYTDITNTNKLIRFYDGCDGGKTGFTSEAGFCLAATAKRGDMRIISVVIGEPSGQKRFDDIKSLFDYAFASCTLKTVVDAENLLNSDIPVSGGKKKYVSVRPERNSYVFSKRGEEVNVSVEIDAKKSLRAPIGKGEKVGTIRVFKDGILIDELAVVADSDIKEANLFDRMKRIGEDWGF